MVASVNTNFIVQNGLTVGPTTIFAGNGDVLTTGNISVTGGGSFGGLSSNQIYQGTSNVNINTGSVTVSVGGANVATFTSSSLTLTGSLTVQGTTTTVNTETATTINATTLQAVTIGNSGAVLYGTLNSASASQTNITAVGTLTGLTVAGTTNTQTVQPSANVTYNLGSTTAWWNNIYGTATHALYADLAENYQADAYYEPGTVVEFGGSKEVTVGSADSKRVAGVVSTNPAHLMNGGLSGPNVVALALQGRVPCKVIGPVAQGDLMVSAGFGFAKVNNDALTGQVIGKALQSVAFAGKAVIEVVVGRV